MDPLIAIYDACALYSNFQRDFLVRLAIHGRRHGLLLAKWTGRIHREWIGAVVRQGAAPREKLNRTRQLMDRHVRGCRVHGYQCWERKLLRLGVPMPDPNDIHVLAAAIACAADVIVTHNLADFPAVVLSPFGITTATPDQFAMSLFKTAVIVETAHDHRGALVKPPLDVDEYLVHMRHCGMGDTAAALSTESI